MLVGDHLPHLAPVQMTSRQQDGYRSRHRSTLHVLAWKTSTPVGKNRPTSVASPLGVSMPETVVDDPLLRLIEWHSTSSSASGQPHAPWCRDDEAVGDALHERHTSSGRAVAGRASAGRGLTS